jgi:F0F1-type ATP synthase assembly protein I
MKENRNKNSLENYARYSSLAIQMLVIIFIGVFGGFKLDALLHTSPLFTVLLSLLAVAAAIYNSVKDFIKPGRKN